MSTHTALTALYAANVAAAGSDYMWDGITGTQSCPRGDAFPGLVAFLAIAQQGICAACGDEFGSETLNVCHIVSQGPRKRGYVAGNLYLGHRGCNETDITYGAAVPLASLIRADLIPTTYPTRADMLALATAHDRKSDRAARRAAAMAG